MNEIEILDKSEIKERKGNIQLPVNFISIGEVSVDDVKIYIKQDVYNLIEKFSREDTSHECGGVLLGNIIESSSKKNIVISAFIEAKYTDASASTLTFTHETWDYIHKEQDKLYPDMKIVGWQHTHPGYGIFLSNYDIFIQENFFNLPWQIAYVVDPIADTRGFFQWRKDKIEKTGGFYVFDEVGKKLSIKQHKASKDMKKQSSRLFNIIMYCLIVVFAASTVFFYFERKTIEEKYSELIKTNSEITEQIEKLETENKKQESNISEVKEASEMQEKSDGKDFVRFKVYIIKDGDTLQKICNENNLDYMNSKAMILKINSITDENKIYSGESIYLPME